MTKGDTAGDFVQPRRDRLGDVDAQQTPGELADLGDVERCQPNAPRSGSGCAGERLTDRSGSEICATGDDDGEVRRLVRDQVCEELERDHVRPVQILEHQDRRRYMLEQLRRRAEDLMPRLTLIRRSLRWNRETIGDLRHERSQAAHDGAQPVPTHAYTRNSYSATAVSIGRPPWHGPASPFFASSTIDLGADHYRHPLRHVGRRWDDPARARPCGGAGRSGPRGRRAERRHRRAGGDRGRRHLHPLAAGTAGQSAGRRARVGR